MLAVNVLLGGVLGLIYSDQGLNGLSVKNMWRERHFDANRLWRNGSDKDPFVLNLLVKNVGESKSDHQFHMEFSRGKSVHRALFEWRGPEVLAEAWGFVATDVFPPRFSGEDLTSKKRAVEGRSISRDDRPAKPDGWRLAIVFDIDRYEGSNSLVCHVGTGLNQPYRPARYSDVSSDLSFTNTLRLVNATARFVQGSFGEVEGESNKQDTQASEQSSPPGRPCRREGTLGHALLGCEIAPIGSLILALLAGLGALIAGSAILHDRLAQGLFGALLIVTATAVHMGML